MTIVGAALALGMLALIFKLTLGSKRGFDLGRALPSVDSLRGEATGRLLSMLVICTVLTTTDVIPPNVLRAFAVPAVLAVAIGTALAPQLTDRLLSLLGVVLALIETGHRYGGATALVVFVIAALGLWIMGLIRGFTGR